MAIFADKYQRSRFAEVLCRGTYSMSDLLNVLDDALTFAADVGKDAVLVDCNDVTGVPSVSDRFDIGRGFAETQLRKPHLVTLAFVGKTPLVDPSRLAETVAVNRCAVARVFDDREEAICWLEQTSG